MNAPAFFPRKETARHRFTVDDVWRMVEAGVIAPDASFEILDGEIIDMASEGEVHLTFKTRLIKALILGLGEGWDVVPDGTLHLAEEDAPEPDAYVVPAGTRLRPVASSSVKLVVEIADTSLGYDLGRKAEKYAHYGLAEYWVVDIHARRTHVLTHPSSGAYGEILAVPFESTLTPRTLPMLSIRFDDLVAPVP